MINLPTLRLALFVPVVVAAMLLLSACGDDPTSPAQRWLTVTTVTTGAGLDPDGYSLLVQGVPVATLDPTDSVRIVRTEPSVDIELTDLAANCAVAGEARRSLSLARQSVARETFALHCTAHPVLYAIRLLLVHDATPVTSDLFEMRADGSERRRITTNEHSSQPTVSADGSRIAYIWQPGGPESQWVTEVRVLDVGAEELVVREEDGWVTDPSLSPDGTLLLYAVDVWWSSEIRMRRLEEAEPTIFSATGYDYGPEWSPDGSRIAFVSWRDGVSTLNTVRPDGSELVAVHASPNILDPVWSPSADRIAFQSSHDAWIVPAGGGGAELLLAGDEHTIWSPSAWSLDGRYIVLTRWYREDGDVFLLDVDEGTLLRITGDGASHSAVVLPAS